MRQLQCSADITRHTDYNGEAISLKHGSD